MDAGPRSPEAARLAPRPYRARIWDGADIRIAVIHPLVAHGDDETLRSQILDVTRRLIDLYD